MHARKAAARVCRDDKSSWKFIRSNTVGPWPSTGLARSKLSTDMSSPGSESSISWKVWKKAWPENATPAPPLPRVFFGTSYHTKRVKKKPSHTKRSKKSLWTLEAHGAKSSGNPYVWQGTIPERSEKSLTRKRETCPPTAKVFFGTSYHRKMVQKKPSHTKRVQKQPSDTGGPWGQVNWEPKRLTRDYSRKVWKKAWPENATPAPPLPRVFFGTSYHTKRVKKKPSHTKRVQKKPSMGPSQVGTQTSNKGLFQKGLKKKPDQKTQHLPPPLPRVFLGHPTTQKRSKKNLRRQVEKKDPDQQNRTEGGFFWTLFPPSTFPFP